jgi:hypothetical protein
MSQEDVEGDVLHIGNLVGILSEAHGYTVGRVVYRDLTMIRVMPQEVSDRAIEFPMTADGSSFAPDLGVSTIEVIETQPSDYYVDFLGARPGETLEFFTVDGQEAAASGVVEEVIKTASKDSIKLTDGRVIKFRGIGPPSPIAVVRVVSEIGAVAADADTVPVEAEETKRHADIFALLSSVLPVATVETVPTAERSYPDSMQREDLFQDLLAEVSAKQRTNPRRIRFVEREVDLALALKNKSLNRDDTGRITGTTPYLVTTVQEAITASSAAVPSAIPIVAAARILNLDDAKPLSHKESDVVPRSLATVEAESEELSTRYLDGALPETVGRGFYAYTYDLLSRGQGVLQGQNPMGWREDQDVIRTAGVGNPVQGLSAGLSRADDEDAPPVSLAFLVSDVTDRSIRVLAADTHTNRKTGEVHILGPSDPSKLVGYTIVPPKAALQLRPPTRPGHLPTALLYSASLEGDNLPTIAQTLRDLYSPDTESPLNTWTLTAEAAGETEVATWLSSVLRYAVHPVDSLGPRSPQLLSLLDTLGLSVHDLAPAVADVVWAWTAESQSLWRSLIVERRKVIQTALDAEEPRVFQSVVGIAEPLWPALRIAEPLQELMEDIRRRNPTIAEAPTLMTASLLTEAQGDAAPLVWAEIAKLDSREFGLDPVVSAAALSASRAYILKRKALRDLHISSLSGAPEVSTCPHAVRLEAIRNVTDVLSRSRLLRDFIEEFQGPKAGEWMTCILCKANCVCYHELMELEALAQPARMDAIQKQMLIKFGGDRYEGKIVCRNCGQALQEIDYDEHVEFDDNGRPIQTASVLTEEQLEEPTETAWKKATADLAPPPVVFATQSQRDLGDALQLMIERGGLQVAPDIVRQIVRYADLYVSLRAPPADLYEKQRTRMLTAASTKIKTATGVTGATVDVPSYAAVLDQLRVSALTALTAIALQSADPPIAVNNPFPLCKLSRGGYPFDPTAKPEDDGALLYMACVVASIQRDTVPWRSLTWSGESKLEPRRKKALQVAFAATQIILGADPKSAPLSFTPEVRSALSKAQNDVVALKAKALVSHGDELPNGFRPDPFPPTMSRPSVEKDPVPAVLEAIESGTSVGTMIPKMAHAMRQQGIAVVGELHATAAEAISALLAVGQKPPTTDAVCCPVSFRDATKLQGEPEQLRLVKASKLLRGAIPTATNAGTHLWPAFETPVPVPVDQEVDEGVFFKLFLKYCYRGAQVGEAHEFSVGNSCRQCGLSLGKPVDTIDFGKDGAAILGNQQGDLRIEVTQVAFQALSEAVRRRRIMVPTVHAGRDPWISGLRTVAAAASQKEGSEEERFGPLLSAALVSLEEQQGPLDEIGRATLWAPFAAYMDTVRAEVGERIGFAGTGARGREAQTAMTMFDALTEDPFIEGPRALQEYWCAKVQAAGSNYTVTKVTGAVWAALSKKHNDMMNKLVSDNSLWFGGDVTEGMRPVLRSLAKSIGPLLRSWIRMIRPSSALTVEETRMILRTLVLESWRDALTPSSWMYQTVASPAERETTAAAVANWTRALMYHVKQQFVKFSKETIKRILQDRAGLERDTIVEEFESIKDDDVRAAELLKKQFRIGRWGQGANLQKYDADTFEFENEQRKRMGIVDPPVDPILLEGMAPAFVLAAEPEDGYDVEQGADGDDY